MLMNTESHGTTQSGVLIYRLAQTQNQMKWLSFEIVPFWWQIMFYVLMLF